MKRKEKLKWKPKCTMPPDTKKEGLSKYINPGGLGPAPGQVGQNDHAILAHRRHPPKHKSDFSPFLAFLQDALPSKAPQR